jgi:hypothetical protein
MASSDPKREWLRHTRAIAPYRRAQSTLFRGLVSDALTHGGQWARLRSKPGASGGGQQWAGSDPKQDAAERVF